MAPVLKEPCHTTSSTETASRITPSPSSRRFFMTEPVSIVPQRPLQAARSRSGDERTAVVQDFVDLVEQSLGNKRLGQESPVPADDPLADFGRSGQARHEHALGLGMNF